MIALLDIHTKFYFDSLEEKIVIKLNGIFTFLLNKQNRIFRTFIVNFSVIRQM